MNETNVTVVGNVAQEPKLRVTGVGAKVASFRLAVTERRFHRQIGEWRDGSTTWYTVTCWRSLAENVFSSVRKGQPVVVHGRFRTSGYEDKEGQHRTVLEIEATAVGHDMARGVSVFTKAESGASEQQLLAAELASELDQELDQALDRAPGQEDATDRAVHGAVDDSAA